MITPRQGEFFSELSRIPMLNHGRKWEAEARLGQGLCWRRGWGEGRETVSPLTGDCRGRSHSCGRRVPVLIVLRGPRFTAITRLPDFAQRGCRGSAGRRVKPGSDFAGDWCRSESLINEAANVRRNRLRSGKCDATFYWIGQKESYLWVITPTRTTLFVLPKRVGN